MPVKSSTSYIIKIFVILFCILIINYIDRAAIAFAIQPISQSFHLNKTQFGMLASSFAIGYVIMTIGGGILVDKKSAHKVLTCSIVIWSLVAIGFGLAVSIVMLWIMRIMLGASEGPSFSSTTQVVAQNISIKYRVLAMAIILAAVPFASVIGSPLVCQLMSLVGWRAVYNLMGAIGIVLAVLWFKTYKDNTATITQTQEAYKENYLAILLNPSLMANNIGYFAYGYLLFFLLIWLPDYFQHNYALDLKTLGWIVSIPWISGTFFTLIGGFISDKIFAKTNSFRLARSYVIFISQLLTACAFIPLLFQPSLFMAVVWMALGAGLGLLATPVFYSVNIDLAKAHAGTAQGTMNCFFAIAGIIAPAITGYLTEHTHNFHAAILLLIAIMLMAVIVIFIFQRQSTSS